MYRKQRPSSARSELDPPIGRDVRADIRRFVGPMPRALAGLALTGGLLLGGGPLAAEQAWAEGDQSGHAGGNEGANGGDSVGGDSVGGNSSSDTDNDAGDSPPGTAATGGPDAVGAGAGPGRDTSHDTDDPGYGGGSRSDNSDKQANETKAPSKAPKASTPKASAPQTKSAPAAPAVAPDTTPGLQEHMEQDASLPSPPMNGPEASEGSFIGNVEQSGFNPALTEGIPEGSLVEAASPPVDSPTVEASPDGSFINDAQLSGINTALTDGPPADGMSNHDASDRIAGNFLSAEESQPLAEAEAGPIASGDFGENESWSNDFSSAPQTSDLGGFTGQAPGDPGWGSDNDRPGVEDPGLPSTAALSDVTEPGGFDVASASDPTPDADRVDAGLLGGETPTPAKPEQPTAVKPGVAAESISFGPPDLIGPVTPHEREVIEAQEHRPAPTPGLNPDVLSQEPVAKNPQLDASGLRPGVEATLSVPTQQLAGSVPDLTSFTAPSVVPSDSLPAAGTIAPDPPEPLIGDIGTASPLDVERPTKDLSILNPYEPSLPQGPHAPPNQTPQQAAAPPQAPEPSPQPAPPGAAAPPDPRSPLSPTDVDLAVDALVGPISYEPVNQTLTVTGDATIEQMFAAAIDPLGHTTVGVDLTQSLAEQLRDFVEDAHQALDPIRSGKPGPETVQAGSKAAPSVGEPAPAPTARESETDVEAQDRAAKALDDVLNSSPIHDALGEAAVARDGFASAVQQAGSPAETPDGRVQNGHAAFPGAHQQASTTLGLTDASLPHALPTPDGLAPTLEAVRELAGPPASHKSLGLAPIPPDYDGPEGPKPQYGYEKPTTSAKTSPGSRNAARRDPDSGPRRRR